MKALLLTSALSVVTSFSALPSPAGVPVYDPSVEPAFGVIEHRDVAYGSVLNLSTNQVDGLRLDFYEPSMASDQDRPVVFWVHGGGFTAGDKAEMEAYCRYFATRGYVAIAPNYRLVSAWDRQNLGAIYAAADVQAAVRWVRTVADDWHFDTDRIALCGASSGAFAVLGAAYDQSLKVHNPNYADQSIEVAACAEVSGRLYDLSSLETGEVPLLIVHGVQDPVVPFRCALDLVRRTNKEGVPSETLFSRVLGHALMRSSSAVILPTVFDFLRRRMIEK